MITGTDVFKVEMIDFFNAISTLSLYMTQFPINAHPHCAMLRVLRVEGAEGWLPTNVVLGRLVLFRAPALLLGREEGGTGRIFLMFFSQRKVVGDDGCTIDRARKITKK